MKLKSLSGRAFTHTLAAGAIMLFGQLSFAVLGEDVGTVDRDAAAYSGTHTVKNAASYSVHEIKTNNKTIKEFVASNGQVFAVSWRGRVHPDLSVILGSYHQEFASATPTRISFSGARANGRAPTMTATTKMKLFKGGHMGDVNGMAYDPALLPAGVRAEDLLTGDHQ